MAGKAVEAIVAPAALLRSDGEITVDPKIPSRSQYFKACADLVVVEYIRIPIVVGKTSSKNIIAVEVPIANAGIRCKAGVVEDMSSEIEERERISVEVAEEEIERGVSLTITDPLSFDVADGSPARSRRSGALDGGLGGSMSENRAENERGKEDVGGFALHWMFQPGVYTVLLFFERKHPKFIELIRRLWQNPRIEMVRMQIMKSQFLSAFITYLLPVLAVFFIAYGCNMASDTGMQFCRHRYALCTSAPCIPLPGDPTRAVCSCDVEEGASMSTVPCSSLTPSRDSNGVQTLYSTFSFEQFKEGKRIMKCPGSSPWTWCLNKRCTVDPSNPEKAICICDVVRTGEEWITYGGGCDPSTCGTAYWSGAKIKDFEAGNVFMTRALGLDRSPVKWCPSE